MPEPESTAPKQDGGRFRRGVSGNPRGRPKGARHRTTVMCEKLLADDAGNVVRAVIAAAVGGDMTAAKLVLDRVVPVRKGALVTLDNMPPLTSTADLIAATATLIEAAAAGRITPGEASDLAALLSVFGKAVELHDVEARLRALEARHG